MGPTNISSATAQNRRLFSCLDKKRRVISHQSWSSIGFGFFLGMFWECFGHVAASCNIYIAANCLSMDDTGNVQESNASRIQLPGNRSNDPTYVHCGNTWYSWWSVFLSFLYLIILLSFMTWESSNTCESSCQWVKNSIKVQAPKQMDEHGSLQALPSTRLWTYFNHLCRHGNVCKDQHAKEGRYGSMSSMA